MRRGLTGAWVPQSVGGRDYDSFRPTGLPPSPALTWNETQLNLLLRATAGASRLDGAARLLPQLQLFLYSYIRKEAVLSSQIEGTQSSLSDLLRHESELTPGVPLDDVTEVSGYAQALNIGVDRMQAGEELSVELILDLHRILLSNRRGASKDPGKIRSGQNWIGGKTPDRAIFVPPPSNEVIGLLERLIDYCNNSTDHVLVKSALAHVQFETIHPFRDGNGRIGRLLITLMMCKGGIISEPLIYLSLYFKENRDEYYKMLQDVRINGDWEAWLSFFLTGVSEVTESAFKLTGKIQKLFEHDSKRIRDNGGRKAHGMLELYRALQQSPALTITRAAKLISDSVTKPTLYAAAEALKEMKLISIELNDQSIQVLVYDEYLDLIRG